jgi:hypothetical protein
MRQSDIASVNGLADSCETFGVKLIGYVLMRNNFQSFKTDDQGAQLLLQ